MKTYELLDWFLNNISEENLDQRFRHAAARQLLMGEVRHWNGSSSAAGGLQRCPKRRPTWRAMDKSLRMYYYRAVGILITSYFTLNQ